MGDLAALADSMQDYGLQQPISVRATGDRFVLTSGLRRVTAARMLGWQSIPAFVRYVNADDAYLLDVIENLQRQDLTPDEEADAFRELIDTRGWSVRKLSQAIKRSAAYVSKRLRVFEDGPLRVAIVEGGLPVSTAEELLAAEPSVRAALLERAVAECWDQARARRELQARADNSASLNKRSSREGATLALSGRPPGLTRAIREFHHLLDRVQPGELTSSDRSALRSLYRDMTMLARAPTTPGPRILPPLPTVHDTGRQGGRTSA